MINTDPTKHRVWTQVIAKGKQFLSPIKHPPSYSYSQNLCHEAHNIYRCYHLKQFIKGSHKHSQKGFKTICILSWQFLYFKAWYISCCFLLALHGQIYNLPKRFRLHCWIPATINKIHTGISIFPFWRELIVNKLHEITWNLIYCVNRQLSRYKSCNLHYNLCSMIGHIRNGGVKYSYAHSPILKEIRPRIQPSFSSYKFPKIHLSVIKTKLPLLPIIQNETV